MHTILCEKPVLIFNPRLKYLVNLHRRVCLDGNLIEFHKKVFSSFPWKIFYQYRRGVTIDNVDNYYIIDDDGQTYPVFMYVPCGHCRICRAKWLRDWETRCICESACHPYPPHFVTLTYAPENRPTTMSDCYIDFDLFMKRFRLYADRLTGKKNSLRYVACSEYTPKNHYPHIHMLVWGLPYIPNNDGNSSAFQALHDFVQDDCWQLGYVKIEVARDPSGKYGFKYLKKNDDSDCWFHSSRRPGIGHHFCKFMQSQIEKTLDLGSISVTVFGKLHKDLPIPAYFKRVWFPTLSLLFPSDILKSAKRLHESALILKTAYPYLKTRLSLDKLNIFQKIGNVAEKFDILEIDYTDFDTSSIERIYSPVLEKLNARDKLIPLDTRKSVVLPTLVDGKWLKPSRTVLSSPDGIPLYRRSDVSFRPGERFEVLRDIVTAYRTFNQDYKDLMCFHFDKVDFQRKLQNSQSHAEFVRSYCLTTESPVTVESKLHDIAVDNRWIAEHWSNDPLDWLY